MSNSLFTSVLAVGELIVGRFRRKLFVLRLRREFLVCRSLRALCVVQAAHHDVATAGLTAHDEVVSFGGLESGAIIISSILFLMVVDLAQTTRQMFKLV